MPVKTEQENRLKRKAAETENFEAAKQDDRANSANKKQQSNTFAFPRLPLSNMPNSETEDEFLDKLHSTELALEAGIDMTAVRDGHDDILKNFESGHGNLTQAQYDLVIQDNLSEQTLLEHSGGKVTKRNKGIRMTVVSSRYKRIKVPDGNEGKFAVFDVKRNKEFLPPKLIFDAVLQTHLMNMHLTADKIYSGLQDKYANVVRDCCRRGVQFCSHCNKELDIKPFQRLRRIHITKKTGLLPLERVQMDLFKPFSKKEFGNRIIEDKYPYILYLKDFCSRYIWVYPLENVTVGDILPIFKQFLMSTAVNVPIYLESCTISSEMMKNLIEYVCSEYGLKLGSGLGRTATFQKSGIRTIKKYLKQRADECLNDWGRVLQLIHEYNNEYNSVIMDIPRRLLRVDFERNKEFETKKTSVLEALPASSFKRYYGKSGFFYVEPEDSKFSFDEDSNEFVHDESSNPFDKKITESSINTTLNDENATP
ncbi:hypothetical protein ACO0QE_002785 [Hanseniaspora vineae]